MPKTLLISEVFPPIHGGSGRWFYELYSRLPGDAYVIAAGKASNDNEFDNGTDLNTYRLNLASETWGLKSISGARFYWKTFKAIKKIIKENDIDSVHCGRCIPEGVIGYLLKMFLGIPYICYVHGEEMEFSSYSRELSFLVRLAMKNSDLMICNSENTRNILIENWSVKPTKIEVLNPGVNSETFVPAKYNIDVRNSLGWGERPVILTVGRLQKRKGQDMLLKALPDVMKLYPDVLYAIVGNGEEKIILDQLVKELDLKDNVVFMTELSDSEMINCYQQCTLFALPNRTVDKDIEGFGMVLVEAQSCGKAVIAGDSGGTAETMVVGESGYVVDCTKPAPLAEKLIDMLGDRDSLGKMGIKGRKHVVQNLDWKAHAVKAIRLFESL